MKKGLTLIELIVASVIVSMLLLIVSSSYSLHFNSMIRDMRLANVRLQVDYALENIRLHCVSSIRIENNSLFPAGITSEKTRFCFEGENNVYNITPDNLTDNSQYCYYINTAGDLVLSTNTVKEEILVEKAYSPAILFSYNEGDEPNLMRVNLTAQLKNSTIAKNEAISLWFSDLLNTL
jgi:prepilin-type N-terminal cleavage/methylation domain-containing protein